MKRPDGRMPQWLLLLLLMQLLSHVLGRTLSRHSKELDVWDVSCCSVQPSRSEPWTVTCDCPGEKMILGNGFFPRAVRSVNFLRLRSVVIKISAIENLDFLANFTISDTQQVVLKRSGMLPHKRAPIRRVYITNASSLLIQNGSFSGVWKSQTTIEMDLIEHIDIESNAFDYRSDDLGPSISLQNVKVLNMSSSGFAAPIFDFLMKNVTMDTCHGQSFGKNAVFSEWNNVTIAQAKNKCFHSMNDQASFKVVALRVNNTHPGAFSGKLNDLIIQESYFNTVQKKGFDMSVIAMQLTKSRVIDLQSESLSVLVSESIRLEKTRIEYLRKNALIGIKMNHSKEELNPRISLNKLTIISAENDSLSLSACAKVQMIGLDMLNPWPRICPAHKWVQALSGGGTEDKLNPAQYQLYMQLFRRRMCPESSSTRFPTLVELPSCRAKDNQIDAGVPVGAGDGNSESGIASRPS